MAFSFNRICSNIIPKGTYKAEISNIKFKEGSADTHFNLEVTYTILDGAYAKHTLKDTIYEKAFSFRLKPFLTAVGMDMNREFTTAKELYEYGIKEAMGKQVMLTVSTRMYNGNEYNNVDTWAALAGSTASVADVLSEFEDAPEVLPENPTVKDMDLTTADEPIASLNNDDLPF